MTIKEDLHKKLTEERALWLSTGTDPVGSNTGENGTFSIEQQAQRPVFEILRDNLEKFFFNLAAVKANLKDVLPVAVALTDAGKPSTDAMRFMLHCIEEFEAQADAAGLHTALNDIHKRIGGSGLPYFK